MRGFLWQNLGEEVAAEFEQTHPLVQLASEVPYWLSHGWHVEGTLGDMSGVRKSEKGRRRGTKSTESVRETRARRKEAGLCIDCEIERDPKSKNYCSRHREEDRQRAARKRGMREKLAKTREGLTLHFTITARAPDHMQVRGEPPKLIEVDGYVSTGIYDDGRLGEFFIRVAKEHEALGPAIDRWAEATSIALQYGAPVDVILKKSVGTFMEPAGPVTGVKGIARCTSPHDLIARWLLSKYGSDEMKAKMAEIGRNGEMRL